MRDKEFMQNIIGTNKADRAASVTEATEANFGEVVIHGSQDMPVIVDFWAPWCEPCRQLAPMLEKAVQAARGAVKLVKVNIDENPVIAQQLRIQSIPAVFAFHRGRPVDGFMGVIPESQIAAFVSRLAQEGGAGADEELVKIGQEALKAGDLARAAQAFGQALQDNPENPQVIAGLARCFLEAGDLAQAKDLLAKAPEAAQQHADMESVRAAIELKERAGAAAGKVESLKQRVSADPGDHQARIDLAQSLAALDEREEAVAQLLESLRRDRTWNDEAARKALLKLFEAFGPNDPATVAGRRKLSSILFA